MAAPITFVGIPFRAFRLFLFFNSAAAGDEPPERLVSPNHQMDVLLSISDYTALSASGTLLAMHFHIHL